MKQYKITVNGKSYDVAVEEVQGVKVSAPVQAIPVKEVTPQPVAKPVEEQKVSADPKPVNENIAGATSVKAVMPGTILSFNVAVGDQVKEGDILLILEAMKMENEITSSVSGIVKSINVDKGASVVEGEILLQIG